MIGEQAQHCERMSMAAGAVYDAIHERLALTRTRWLMGDQDSAKQLFTEAQEDYTLYKHTLPGYAVEAIDHAFEVTHATILPVFLP